MMNKLNPFRVIKKGDDRSKFSCGNQQLDNYIKLHAYNNHRAGNARVYVATYGEDSRVVGYYTLSASAVTEKDTGKEFAKHRPKEIPAILLGRFAVDKAAQRQGLGAALLKDAIENTIAAGIHTGVAAMLIHCIDDEAKSFYTKNLDCLVSPFDPMILVIPMKVLRKFLDKR